MVKVSVSVKKQTKNVGAFLCLVGCLVVFVVCHFGFVEVFCCGCGPHAANHDKKRDG